MLSRILLRAMRRFVTRPHDPLFSFLGTEKRGAFLFASRFISIRFKLIRISFKGLEW